MDSWIGGDIAGLQQVADSLARPLPDLRGSVRALSADVDSLVGDARWRGEAAESFRAAWTTDAITASGLADVVQTFSTTLATLSADLNRLDRELQDAAHEARQHGVAIGSEGGLALTETGGSPEQIHMIAQAAADYDQIRAQFLNLAAQARERAADILGPLSVDISPSATRSLVVGEQITEADYLRGLWAFNDERVRRTRTRVESAEDARDAAYERMQDEKAALRATGKKVSRASRTAEFKEARAELRAEERELAAASRYRIPLEGALNYKISDFAADVGVRAERLEQLPDFLRDVPVIDVAAVIAVGGTEAKEDHDKGWSWTHSVLVDGSAAAGGLLAGVIVAVSLPIDAAAAAAVGGTAAALATAVVEGGFVIGVGVGIDLAVHEHWSEDIHDHGIVSGVAHGAGHVATETGETLKNMATGVWHGVSSVL